jgi:hypothetical protein
MEAEAGRETSMKHSPKPARTTELDARRDAHVNLTIGNAQKAAWYFFSSRDSQAEVGPTVRRVRNYPGH